VGIGDLLAAARLMGSLPQAVALVAIQPGEIAIGLELTDAVEAAVPAAVQAAVDELRSLAAAAGASGPVVDRSVATAAMG
jgi:Ni,Fe-hydrogenase maturation factor